MSLAEVTFVGVIDEAFEARLRGTDDEVPGNHVQSANDAHDNRGSKPFGISLGIVHRIVKAIVKAIVKIIPKPSQLQMPNGSAQ